MGASRGLRRLAVTPIDRTHLEPMDGVTAGELGGAIDADASLEDALALLMREDKPMIGVKQGATFLGVLTPERGASGAAGLGVVPGVSRNH